MTEVKYGVIYGDDRNEEIEFFDTLGEANKKAESVWEHYTDREQKTNHVETIDIRKEDLSDPDDWESYTAYGYCSGRFNSDRWYAVMMDDDETHDWGTGSYYINKAIEMAKDMDADYIAVISIGSDPICIDEIRDFGAVACQ